MRINGSFSSFFGGDMRSAGVCTAVEPLAGGVLVVAGVVARLLASGALGRCTRALGRRRALLLAGGLGRHPFLRVVVAVIRSS